MKILCCAACGHALIDTLDMPCPACGGLTTARFTLHEKALVSAKYKGLADREIQPVQSQMEFEENNKDLFG